MRECLSGAERDSVLIFFRKYLEEAIPGPITEPESGVIIDTVFDPANSGNLNVVIELIQAKDAIRQRLLVTLMKCALKKELEHWERHGVLRWKDFQE